MTTGDLGGVQEVMQITLSILRNLWAWSREYLKLETGSQDEQIELLAAILPSKRTPFFVTSSILWVSSAMLSWLNVG